MRPRVAFLVAGQVRCAAFGAGPDGLGHAVAAHLRRNVFNDALDASFEYDVFMSVDVASRATCDAFFGPHLASFECLPELGADVQCPGFEVPISAFNYRLQRAWRAMSARAMSARAPPYDLVVKLRPDVEYYHDLVPCLLALQRHPEKQMVFVWDIAWAGRHGIMEACCNQYGAFFPALPASSDRDPVFGSYYSRSLGRPTRELTTVPEFQLAECAMKYVRDRGLRLPAALVDSRINFKAVRWARSHHDANGIPADAYDRAREADFP